jgi:hypothetical protein
LIWILDIFLFISEYQKISFQEKTIDVNPPEQLSFANFDQDIQPLQQPLQQQWQPQLHQQLTHQMDVEQQQQQQIYHQQVYPINPINPVNVNPINGFSDIYRLLPQNNINKKIRSEVRVKQKKRKRNKKMKWTIMTSHDRKVSRNKI